MICLGLSFWGTSQNEPLSFLFNIISAPFGLNIATGFQLNKLAKGANLIVKFEILTEEESLILGRSLVGPNSTPHGLSPLYEPIFKGCPNELDNVFSICGEKRLIVLSTSRSAPLQIKTPPNAAKVPASPQRFNLLELHSSPMKHYSQTWGS